MSMALVTGGGRGRTIGVIRAKQTAKPVDRRCRPIPSRTGNTAQAPIRRASLPMATNSTSPTWRGPGAEEIQLDLIRDYRNNVALYPDFQAYFRKHQPPLLAA